ncbi:hypothetical protein EVG20_g5522, partial [Dentipellis fragilis]
RASSPIATASPASPDAPSPDTERPSSSSPAPPPSSPPESESQPSNNEVTVSSGRRPERCRQARITAQPLPNDVHPAREIEVPEADSLDREADGLDSAFKRIDTSLEKVKGYINGATGFVRTNLLREAKTLQGQIDGNRAKASALRAEAQALRDAAAEASQSSQEGEVREITADSGLQSTEEEDVPSVEDEGVQSTEDEDAQAAESSAEGTVEEEVDRVEGELGHAAPSPFVRRSRMTLGSAPHEPQSTREERRRPGSASRGLNQGPGSVPSADEPNVVEEKRTLADLNPVVASRASTVSIQTNDASTRVSAANATVELPALTAAWWPVQAALNVVNRPSAYSVGRHTVYRVLGSKAGLQLRKDQGYEKASEGSGIEERILSVLRGERYATSTEDGTIVDRHASHRLASDAHRSSVRRGSSRSISTRLRPLPSSHGKAFKAPGLWSARLAAHGFHLRTRHPPHGLGHGAFSGAAALNSPTPRDCSLAVPSRLHCAAALSHDQTLSLPSRPIHRFVHRAHCPDGARLAHFIANVVVNIRVHADAVHLPPGRSAERFSLLLARDERSCVPPAEDNFSRKEKRDDYRVSMDASGS